MKLASRNLTAALCFVVLSLVGSKFAYGQNYNSPLTPGQFIGAISPSDLSYVYEGNVFLYYVLLASKSGEVKLSYVLAGGIELPSQITGSISGVGINAEIVPARGMSFTQQFVGKYFL